MNLLDVAKFQSRPGQKEPEQGRDKEAWKKECGFLPKRGEASVALEAEENSPEKDHGSGPKNGG